jgi:magnesium transporter
MIKRVLYNGVTWVDLESPTSEEMADLTEEFNLHPLTASELLSQSLSPKIDVHTDHIYLILHFVDDKEVDFVLGKNFIITTRYDAVEPVIKFSRALAQGEQMHDKGFNPGVLFYYITKGLYDELGDALTRLRVRTKAIETSVYSGEERAMVMALSKSGHTILDLQQAIEPHKEVLTGLEHSMKKMYGAEYVRYATALLNNYYKVAQRLKRLLALHNELRATNDSLLAIKQNSIMQAFTVVAFVTLIPSLIASVFGMNARYMPIVGHRYDFWLVVLIMIIVSAGIFSFFKYKRWF